MFGGTIGPQEKLNTKLQQDTVSLVALFIFVLKTSHIGKKEDLKMNKA